MAQQADRYTELINTPIGKLVQKQIGLPAPVPLKRFQPGDKPVAGRVLLGGAPGGRLSLQLAKLVAGLGADASTPLREDLRGAAAQAGLDAGPWTPAAAATQKYGAVIFDATGITEPEQLSELHAFFHPTIRRVQRCGRVVVLGTTPAETKTASERIAQRALEGFARAAGKELKAGATAQLVYVAPGAEDQLESTVRFLLSSKSAYVDGQVIRVGSGSDVPSIDWEQPLAGKVALVTGASRGIGAAIATTLARDGAHVVGLDIPALEGDLKAVTGALGGSALTADITSPEAPKEIAAYLKKEHGGVDVVVHNAGITRDKTLGRMDEDRWNSVINVNLAAAQRITDALIAGRSRAVLNAGGRVVCVASIAGIAGNFGQTNYATSKAGVIGLVDAYAELLGERGATINAVAPGFIETQMTAKIPFATREAGRRMNSLAQGGLPVDVAEAIAYFASPASTGVTGNTVRVCGQSLLGA